MGAGMRRLLFKQHRASSSGDGRSRFFDRAIAPLLAVAILGAPFQLHANKTQPMCLITEFRTIGRSIHHPDLRHNAGMRWLRANLQYCSLEQVRLLSANRTQWYGTADDPELAGVIDQAAELLARDKPELLKNLFVGPSTEQLSAAQTPPSSNVISARAGRLAPEASQAYQQSQQQYSQQYQQQYQQQYPQQYQQAYPQQHQQPAAPSQGGNSTLPTQ